jgi:hypothetical protein
MRFRFRRSIGQMTRRRKALYHERCSMEDEKEPKETGSTQTFESPGGVKITVNDPGPPPGWKGKHAPRETKSRLTVVEMVHHAGPNFSPTTADSRFARIVDSDEAPYVRPQGFKVGKDWKPLDLGWLTDLPCGMLVIRNEMERFTVAPTQEQLQAARSKILEVTFTVFTRADDPPSTAMLVGPGESCRFMPYDPTAIRVRCLHGETKVTLYVFPL